jgi:hypothetical protein
MSKGAGRVEQAIRDWIERDTSCRQFLSQTLYRAAFGGGSPWTPAQRRSVLRAMRRIVAGQPRWSERRTVWLGRVEVEFMFDPPDNATGTNKRAVEYLSPRPPTKRQAEQAERRKLRERKRVLAERREQRAYLKKHPPEPVSPFEADRERRAFGIVWMLKGENVFDPLAILDRAREVLLLRERDRPAFDRLWREYEKAMRLSELRGLLPDEAERALSSEAPVG